MKNNLSRRLLPALGAAALLLAGRTAFALDTIRLGKGGVGLVYATVEIGQAEGIWAKEGLDVQVFQFPGEGPVETAFTAGSIDMALGSGTSMGFTVKGVPQHVVAVLSGPPSDFVLAVNPNGPIKTVADLKGKSIGVTSAGSLTYYFAKTFAQKQGWGPDGVTPQPLGGIAPNFAALANGDIAATVTTPETAAQFAEKGQAKVLISYTDILPHFFTHSILASNDLIANHPDEVKRFLQGWYTTVAFMKDPANRQTAIDLIAKAMGFDNQVASAAFDLEIKGLSSDGAFDPQAIDTIRETLVTLGILPTEPPVKGLYDPDFVPVKLN